MDDYEKIAELRAQTRHLHALGGIPDDHSHLRMQCFEAVLRAKPHLPADEIVKEAAIMLAFVQGGEK